MTFMKRPDDRLIDRASLHRNVFASVVYEPRTDLYAFSQANLRSDVVQELEIARPVLGSILNVFTDQLSQLG
jgi:hypothetical protein